MLGFHEKGLYVQVDFKEFQGRFSEPAVQDILLQNDFFLKTLFV